MNVQIHPRIKFYSKLHLDWIIKLEGRVEFDKVSSKNEWLARQLEFDIISFFYDIDYIIQWLHNCDHFWPELHTKETNKFSRLYS